MLNVLYSAVFALEDLNICVVSMAGGGGGGKAIFLPPVQISQGKCLLLPSAIQFRHGRRVLL